MHGNMIGECNKKTTQNKQSKGGQNREKHEHAFHIYKNSVVFLSTILSTNEHAFHYFKLGKMHVKGKRREM